ncbi:phenylalanine--tRNA ligase subunit beta [Peptoniphilus sp. KCTC 25270]|uniref:phenylalanine--tRNA ligase subunit beta n=1 Tax=Peptoniphilus sp. KCTC 25270 TaxID=2897414 RepID=UPI001E5F4016|nr:phenylalanine--tRNA ligase subunit beta [Peptoniphilus sp. KCTC 25270]MCD1147990.1 phenylalanine--tRNA ligase subunit beta [Peptoniphilus sp. KCTC 25270]
MLLPKSWLEKYVNINISTREMADKITATGSHVESIEKRVGDIAGVVIGKITKIEKHPDADKLVVCQIDIGGENKQIVTGATNVYEGAYVPVALDGAKLADGTVINNGKLRGVESQGMMCSLEEMGFPISVIPKASRDGIHLLPEGTELGSDFIEVLELDKEVIELEITPNRPDCLSVIGMALETAASIGEEFSQPEIKVEENSDKSLEEIFEGLEVETELSPRFYLRGLTDVKIGPSPQWLQNDLMAAGVRPINNIVDLTNYVMLEYGQPLHAYDLEHLGDKKIIVRQAKEGEVLTTLDNNERKLRTEDIIIADGKEPIGLAGIMGGLDSEVTDETTTVILEGANFDEGQIRKTSKHFALRTEASTRFEKGLDPEKSKLAVDRVCELAVEIGAAKVAKGSIDHYPNPVKVETLESDPKRINALLGTDLSIEEMKKILDSLHIFTEIKGEMLESKIPTFRRDITIWQDLAEEVGRIFGFHNIVPQPLAGSLTRGGKPFFRTVEEEARNVLLATGFDEFMTYSFMGPSAFDKIRTPEDSPLRDAVKLINPLGEEYSIMRTTLMPNMLDVFAKNMSYKNPSAYGFEFGNIFSVELNEEGLPSESKKLAIGFYGKEDFYFLKEVIELICHRLGMRDVVFHTLNGNPLLHDGRSAEVFYGEENLGFFGELSPMIAKDLGIKKRLYLAELNFSKMVEFYNDEVKFEALVKYPAIERDLAFVVPRKLPAGDLIEGIKSVDQSLLESVEVFDVYSGDQVGEGMKSIALKLRFRHKERTLKEEEVAPIVEKAIETVEKQFDAKLRAI